MEIETKMVDEVFIAYDDVISSVVFYCLADKFSINH